MNKDIVAGTWKEIRGKVMRRWSLLTDSDLDEIEGTRLELEGLLQKRYGYAKERAHEEVGEFFDTL